VGRDCGSDQAKHSDRASRTLATKEKRNMSDTFVEDDWGSDERDRLARAMLATMEDGLDGKELVCLCHYYDQSDDIMRGVINFVVVQICGYTIPTLMEIAKRGSLKDIEDWQEYGEAPYYLPQIVEAVAKGPTPLWLLGKTAYRQRGPRAATCGPHHCNAP
jgi:hypothetical protein